jgi:hypothetical protein
MIQKRWLFTHEKFIDLNGVDNCQNDRVLAVNREEADKKGGTHEKTKFSVQAMVWSGAYGKG